MGLDASPCCRVVDYCRTVVSRLCAILSECRTCVDPHLKLASSIPDPFSIPRCHRKLWEALSSCLEEFGGAVVACDGQSSHTHYISSQNAHSFTYDHRIMRIRLPVRSAIYKHDTGALVPGWVTTREYALLYVFDLFCV